MSFKSVYFKLCAVLTFCLATSLAYNIDIGVFMNCCKEPAPGHVTVASGAFFEPTIDDDFILTAHGCLTVCERGIPPGSIVRLSISSINGQDLVPPVAFKEFYLCNLEDGSALRGTLKLMGINNTCTIQPGTYCANPHGAKYVVDEFDTFDMLPRTTTRVVLTLLLPPNQLEAACVEFDIVKR